MIVQSEQIELATATGAMRTYLYRPAIKAPTTRQFPGLVFYSEIFQQTEPIRRLAVQIAGHGYIVAVPEVYHDQIPAGAVLGYDDHGKNKGNACKAAMRWSAFDADVNALVQSLKAHSACDGRVGAAGVCLGGHLAFRAALNPAVSATACFYATDLQGSDAGELGNGDTLRRCGEIKGEMLFVWGRQDPHIPLEGRQKVYRALNDAGVTFTWHEVNGAHAFMRDEGDRYDPAAARLGIGLALDLFQRAL